MTAAGVPTTASAPPGASRGGASRPGLHLVLLLELVAATWIVGRFEIEGAPLFTIMLLATAGFAISPWLPRGLRKLLFVLLSMAAIGAIFGWADGALLVGTGLLLIACCHLPVRLSLRVALLLALGTLLALSRGGVVPSPWAAAVWPVLGSIFMFRLAIYLRALGAAGERDAVDAVSYFFMFPNLVFPLYPVIDYQTFRKAWLDRDEWETYERGMLWIARGLMHLVLYRAVYQHVVNDPTDVARLSDLVRYMLGTFLLYLRVSGQFHLIIGLLHLFGYRLPETHHLYYLAQGFTDLWRRINIYWKDFMVQVVFYPTYFRLKRLKPSTALALATTAVFVATWVLHSYQWFWLRGGFPVTMPDILFWGILGGLVVVGALREAKVTTRSKRAPGWQLRPGLKAAATFGVFCFLWSLWSTESVGQWLWLLGAAAQVDALGVLALLGIALALVALGGWNWDAPPARRRGLPALLTGTRPRTIATLASLSILAVPTPDATQPGARGMLASLRTNRLNARDAAQQHRGYYEQLEVRARVDDPRLVKPAGWQDVGSLGVIRELREPLTRDLAPSFRAQWNGKPFSTNRWGMRDRDYEEEKPAGTLRVALLGPSHVMGNGVADGETFEHLLEERLDADPPAGFERVEILNFGVDGFSLPQMVAIMEERALRFAPDVVIITHYRQNRAMTERYLLKCIERQVLPSDRRIATMMTDAGLREAIEGRWPIPYARARSVARAVGLDARMPSAETLSRIRRISDGVMLASFERFGEAARAAGAMPLVLALDDVLDDGATVVPDDAGIRSSSLPVINLLDVYPADQRAQLRVGSWDNHPNAAGHRLIAERMYPELRGLLDAMTPRLASANRPTDTQGGK